MLFKPDYASLALNLRIKKREYSDGIKSRETRPGWCEAHNVYKACVGTTEGFYTEAHKGHPIFHFNKFPF